MCSTIRSNLFHAAEPGRRAHQRSRCPSRDAGRDRPAGGDGRVDGSDPTHVHRRRLSEDRQEAVDKAGMELVRTKHTPDQIKAMLDKAGYNGERIVLLHATDHWFFNPTASVIAHSLSAAGMNIDDQAMDWATVQARPHQPRATGQGRLVDVPVRRCGTGPSSIRCSPTSSAATARTDGSAGPPTQRSSSFTTRGSPLPIQRSRRGWSGISDRGLPDRVTHA